MFLLGLGQPATEGATKQQDHLHAPSLLFHEKDLLHNNNGVGDYFETAPSYGGGKRKRKVTLSLFFEKKEENK